MMSSDRRSTLAAALGFPALEPRAGAPAPCTAASTVGAASATSSPGCGGRATPSASGEVLCVEHGDPLAGPVVAALLARAVRSGGLCDPLI